MASSTSDGLDLPAVERLAAGLLAAMAILAVVCVAFGMGALALHPEAGLAMPGGWPARLLALGRDAVVLAPLVSLVGVAMGARRRQPRLAVFALGALAVTLIGMGLAR